MNLVEWLQGLMTSFGAAWVMWLLIFLSVISVAIMLERGWFYFSLRDDIAKLGNAITKAAAKGARESLVLMDQAALVVSVPNRTVITAVDKNALKENIFTNIDSAMIL